MVSRSKRVLIPMDHIVVVVDADTDEVTSGNPHRLRQTANLGTLGSIDCVERVMAPGESAHLDHQRSGVVPGQNVDLPATNPDVAGDDRKAMTEQK